MPVIYGGENGVIRRNVPLAVTMGQLRRYILLRDTRCLLASTLFPGHRCVGKWGGKPASPTRDEDWTLEHVPQVHDHLDVRRDDDAHTVALCHGTNTKPPSKLEREAMRVALRLLFPDCPSA